MGLKNDWAADGIALVGTATSHFQSEPMCNESVFPSSDWEFELAKRLDKRLGGQPSGIKDAITEPLPRFLPHKREYVKRSARLGLNMFRFSVDLARLNPRLGEFNTELMAEYVRAMAFMRASGQEPLMTLHHFTMPMTFVGLDGKTHAIRRGGWEHPAIVKFFQLAVYRLVAFLSNKDMVREALETGTGLSARTVDKFVNEGLVRYFMPFNEPAVTLGNGYLAGTFPPYRKGRIDKCVQVVRKMAQAYAIMADQLRTLGKWVPPARAPLIGNGYNWQFYDGLGASLLSRTDEWYTSEFEQRFDSDFLGLHYYCRVPLPFARTHPGDRGRGDHPVFGPINPAGVRTVLEHMHEKYPSKNILISEIGFSDAGDLRRPFWLLETARSIFASRRDGIRIKGVLVWSLVDNFEWECGMRQKFGLFSESELSGPLSVPEGCVRSWQVWEALATHIRFPSAKSSAVLDQLWEKARRQYDAVTQAEPLTMA